MVPRLVKEENIPKRNPHFVRTWFVLFHYVLSIVYLGKLETGFSKWYSVCIVICVTFDNGPDARAGQIKSSVCVMCLILVFRSNSREAWHNLLCRLTICTILHFLFSPRPVNEYWPMSLSVQKIVKGQACIVVSAHFPFLVLLHAIDGSYWWHYILFKVVTAELSSLLLFPRVLSRPPSKTLALCWREGSCHSVPLLTTSPIFKLVWLCIISVVVCVPTWGLRGIPIVRRYAD